MLRAEISEALSIVTLNPSFTQEPTIYIYIFRLLAQKKVESQRSLPMVLCASLSKFNEYNACLFLIFDQFHQNM